MPARNSFTHCLSTVSKGRQSEEKYTSKCSHWSCTYRGGLVWVQNCGRRSVWLALKRGEETGCLCQHTWPESGGKMKEQKDCTDSETNDRGCFAKYTAGWRSHRDLLYLNILSNLYTCSLAISHQRIGFAPKHDIPELFSAKMGGLVGGIITKVFFLRP